MQETAHTFCPSRCAASVLCLLWCACSFGVLSIYGLGLRGGCGVLFTAVLLWLSYLDLRDGMLYDCITLPFAVLGLMASGLDSISDALLGGTLCGVLFYCLYIAARGSAAAPSTAMIDAASRTCRS
ncbi:MAG: prepilin peptidase, partial [Selenomonas sp.]|nr:prepilin peptidase [Selenomonas sp.]